MPELKFKVAFELGEEVYVKSDPMQYKGIIVRIAKSWNGGIEYEVDQHPDKDWFQAVQLSKTMDLSITITQIEDGEGDDPD